MYVKCNNAEFLTWFRGDFFHIKTASGATQFQACEPEEEKEIKTNLFYIIGNETIKKAIYIKFDFENSTFEVNNIIYNVVNNYEFTFKKTRGNNILAINGIFGFYNFILSSMNIEKSAFSSYTYGVLEKLAKL